MAEEKKFVPMEERRYAVFTKDSIKMMAESGGHADISDTVAGIMGEDVSYRLREITQKSAQFMRHAKRRRLNTEDFNKACRNSDIPPVHGHGSVESPSPFRQTREGEIYFVEDPDINLATVACNMYVPKQLGDTTIKAHWLAVEGVQKNPQNPQGSSRPEASPLLKKYFDKITQAILGFDSEMMKTALSDLRTNSNISPLLPQFISFIYNGVKTVSHDILQLTKLLYTVRSLVCNPAFFLEPQPYLSLLVQSVQYCLLEPLSLPQGTSCDQWTLRDMAAQLLAQIVSIWGNSVNHLERFTEKSLREVLYDHSKPFSCHYGAVQGLLALGCENIERVLLPHLALYWPHLLVAMEYKGLKSATTQAHALMVHGAIQVSVEFVMKKYIAEFKEQYLPSKESESKDELSSTNNSPFNETKHANTRGFISMFDKSPSSFYKEMSEYFGDSLSLRLGEIPELKDSVYKPSPKEVVASFTDAESSKSGEQLLEDLMEQVRRQEQVNRKKERRKLEGQQSDMQEKLQRQRLEHKRRKEDHRQQLQLRKQRQSLQDSDDEIDVEGDVDRSDNSFQSEKSEEGDTKDAPLAVKSSIGAPGQGIKLTFTKKPKLVTSVPNFTDSPQSDSPDSKERMPSQSRKRKLSARSPENFDMSTMEGLESALAAYTQQSYYSSEGEGTSEGGSARKALTMKFWKKDNSD